MLRHDLERLAMLGNHPAPDKRVERAGRAQDGRGLGRAAFGIDVALQIHQLTLERLNARKLQARL